MSAPRGWCQCGAPLWRDEGCQVCWLVGLTSRHVRTLAEGYSFRPAITLAEANSTDGTDATNDWLPDGAFESWDMRRWYHLAAIKAHCIVKWTIDPSP